MKLLGIESSKPKNTAVDQNRATQPKASGASRAQRGFTLVETLVAALVLAFGLLSVASLLAYSLATNYENRMDSVATNLAIQKMEQLRGQAFSTISSGRLCLGWKRQHRLLPDSSHRLFPDDNL